MDDYLALVVMFVLAVVFVVGSIVTSKLLAPQRRTAAKEAPYECGILPSREPPERFPTIGSFDLLAFWHKPHYVVVEVAALEQTRTEPGRAPAAAVIDDTRQRQYVYMIRNLGTRRQPAFVLTIGAGLIFFTLCWLLHRRERVLTTNRSTAPVPAG